MKWRAYPKYKDSGVEWLGRVPEHWEMPIVRYVAKMGSGAGQATGIRNDNGDVPVYGYARGAGVQLKLDTNPPVVVFGSR